MRRRGFTLLEALLAVSISTVVLAGILIFFVSLAKATLPRTINGMQVAPSLGALRDAIALHHILGQRVGESKAVYVFGGQHRTITSDAIEAQVGPLATTTLPAITSFSSGLPPSVYGFYQSYASQLGGQVAAGSRDPADFTVLVVGPSPAPTGALQVTCMVQVRRATFSAEGENWVQYEATLADLAATASYRFVIPAATDGPWPLPVGATHTWHRYRSGAVAEEGPAITVFPDPHLYAGRTGIDGESINLPRFVFFYQ